MLAITTTRRPRLPGDRRFHTLLLALAASSCGDWLYNVALLVFVYARTGSATWVAVTTAARVLPVVVLGPLGGVVADGLSNGEIAERLVISRKTASVHVSNILGKLGVSGRVEAAALAHRRGLVDLEAPEVGGRPDLR